MPVAVRIASRTPEKPTAPTPEPARFVLASYTVDDATAHRRPVRREQRDILAALPRSPSARRGVDRGSRIARPIFGDGCHAGRVRGRHGTGCDRATGAAEQFEDIRRHVDAPAPGRLAA